MTLTDAGLAYLMAAVAACSVLAAVLTSLRIVWQAHRLAKAPSSEADT